MFLLRHKYKNDAMYAHLKTLTVSWLEKKNLLFLCFLQVAGKWYVVGFATNAQWFVNRKDTMKMGTSMMVPTDTGDLDFSYATLK